MDTGQKYHAELAYWTSWVNQHGRRPLTNYYQRFMMRMGDVADRAFFDGLTCVDIGCGPLGSLSWLTNARAAVGLDPLAVEYRTLGIDRHAMFYIAAGAEAIPLASGSVDAVFSMNSLDHVGDFPGACREIRRILRPGGYFLGSLNLNEPATTCEPWTLTEPLLADRLFAGWTSEFYRVRPKVHPEIEAGGDPYRYFAEECPPEIDQPLGPRALWCRFRTSQAAPSGSEH